MGYLADELYNMIGVRLSAEQESAMEIAAVVLGHSAASFLYVLRKAMQPHDPLVDITPERVQAWIDALRAPSIQTPRPKISYSMTKCKVCGRELGENWLVRHMKQAHGRSHG